MVTVNGTPAVALEGAVKLRIACGVAQPSVIENAIVIVSMQTLRAGAALVAPSRQDSVRSVIMEAIPHESVSGTVHIKQNEAMKQRDWKVRSYSDECGWGLPKRTSIPNIGP